MSLNVTNPPSAAALKTDATNDEHIPHHRDTDRAALLAAVNAVATALAGTLGISAAALPLPTGAATQATLVSISNALGQVLSVRDVDAGEYETVAAGQAEQVIGAAGAAGDFLAGLLIVPATTSPGAVTIKDGNGAAISVFTGGVNSVSNLVPFFVPLGLRAATAWKVTTGANVSVIASGNFT